MNKNQYLTIDQIKQRKEKLQQEIDHIEEKYSRKATKIEGRIQSTLQPIQTIQKNPLKSIGVAIAVGFLIGYSGRKKSKTSQSNQSTHTYDSDSSGFTPLLMNELKRMAVHRAMIYLTGLVDHKIIPGITAAHKNRKKAESNRDVHTS